MWPCRSAALNAADKTVMSPLSVAGASPRDSRFSRKSAMSLLVSERGFIRSRLEFLFYEVIEPLRDRECPQTFAVHALQYLAQQIPRPRFC